MALSNIIKNLRDGTLTILDNAGANTLTVAYEAGDFSFDIPGPGVSEYLDRGVHASPPSVRFNNDGVITGSFTANLRHLNSTTFISLEQILLNSGYFASTWVGTLGSTGEVKLLTIRWTCEGTTHGDSADHELELLYSRLSGSIKEGDPNVVTVNYTSFQNFPGNVDNVA